MPVYAPNNPASVGWRCFRTSGRDRSARSLDTADAISRRAIDTGDLVWISASPPPGLTSIRLTDGGAAAAPGEPSPAMALEALVRLQQLARATAHAAGTYRDGFAVLWAIVKPATDL